MLQKQANTSAEFKHFKIPEVPMQLICMDLVGPISPVTSRGNHFILTCIDMLTGFTIAIPIKDKAADTVCDVYRAHIYCTFGGSARILTDNGSEFKNEQMDKLCAQLNIKRVYSPVYTPEANGRLEAWHHFFKTCVAKHIRENAAEWDEVFPLAAAAYNFFPCQASGESPFVLMFGRDPITPFAKLLEPAPRYWGDCGGHLKMDLLRKLYLLTAENVKRAREGRDPAENTAHRSNFKVNDLVLVRDVTSGAFAPRYSPNYRIVAIHGPNRIVVLDEKGNETVRRSSHLKIGDLKEKVALMVPEQSEYSAFGRSTKLLLHPQDVPDLQFPSKTEENGEILPKTEISVIEVACQSMESVEPIEKCSEIPPNLEISVRKLLAGPKAEKGGEISPNQEKPGKILNINSNKQYIVGYSGKLKMYSEIPLETAVREKTDKVGERSGWLQHPVNCVSKWSKALKSGVISSMGLGSSHTATTDSEEDDKHGFSFFL